MKPVLTTSDLDHEYENWGDENRNCYDLRFGQMISNRYHLVPEGAFHIENKEVAYNYLREKLTEYQR